MRIIFIPAVLSILATINAEDVRLLDLEPTDAQQLIDKQDTTLKYAPKVDSNVPAVRFLGNEPHNVLEDIYLANQYHGQDGLGGYLYGYAVPDIAKTERKKAGGDLRGAYNYIAGNGQEIKVEYWDDGTGFHQVDNVPKILPKQIDDLPEVKAAKEEHYRRWQEEAERNSHPATVPPNYYTPQRAQNQFQPQKYPGFGQSQGQAQGFAQQYSNQQGQGFSQQNPGFGQQGQGFNQQAKAFGQNPGFSQQNPGFGQSQGLSNQASQHSGFGQQTQGFGQQGQAKAFGQTAGFTQNTPQQYSGVSTSQSSFQTSASGHQGQGSGYGQGQGQIGFAASAPAVGTVPAPGHNFAQSSGFNQAQGSAPVAQSHAAPSQNPGFNQQQAQGSAPVAQSHAAPSPSSGFNQQQAQGSHPASVSTSQHSFQSQQANNPGQGHQLSAAGSYQQTTQVKNTQFGGQSGYASQGNQGDGEDDGEYKGHDDEGQYKPESEEEQGPPRGFFYNFDYPVGIIVQKLGKVGGGASGAGFDPHSQQKRESLPEIYEKNKANFQASLGTGSGTQSGYVAY